MRPTSSPLSLKNLKKYPLIYLCSLPYLLQLIYKPTWGGEGGGGRLIHAIHFLSIFPKQSPNLLGHSCGKVHNRKMAMTWRHTPNGQILIS